MSRRHLRKRETGKYLRYALRKTAFRGVGEECESARRGILVARLKFSFGSTRARPEPCALYTHSAPKRKTAMMRTYVFASFRSASECLRVQLFRLFSRNPHDSSRAPSRGVRETRRAVLCSRHDRNDKNLPQWSCVSPLSLPLPSLSLLLRNIATRQRGCCVASISFTGVDFER